MSTRWFLLICGILFVFHAGYGWPQANRTLPAVGILTLSAGPDETIIESFRTGLRRFGYVDGQSIQIEHKYAQGHAERLPQLARELADIKVKAIVTGGGPQVQAALRATTDIPIVIVVHEADPAASKLIESYRRPGGNVTGIYARELETVGKRLELLREAFPHLKQIAALWDRYSRFKLEELKTSAQSLGLVLHPIEVNPPYDFDSVFKSAKAMRSDAALVLLTYAFYVRREQLAAAALRAKLPTMHDKEDMVKAGGLISYGASFDDTWGRAAYFVDRILKGAKPSDLPVEQVSTFRLVINQRTAGALGVSFPQSMLVRADEVIR